MPGPRIPLFPLHVVVFPRTALPLHIFEERYKEMVSNAIKGNTEFGIVLAKQDGILNAGCTVAVEKVVNLYSDGRMDILTRGRQRFEIVSLEDDKPWLEAEVVFFDDSELEAAPEELREQALVQYRQFRSVSTLAGRDEPDLSDHQLSFQLAQSIPDVDFLSLLLRGRSESERLKELTQYLAQYVPRQREIRRMERLAPTNGHGRRPTET